jgi:hypothetical protein
MRSFALGTLSLSLALAACGGGGGDTASAPPPPPQVAVRSQLSAGATISCPVVFSGLQVTVRGAYLGLSFSGADGVCADAQAGQQRAGTTVAVVLVDAGLAGTFAIQPGTWTVSDRPPPLSGTSFRGALSAVARTDAACVPGAPVTASGTLVLSALDVAGARGTLDLALRDAAGGVVGLLQRPFDAPACGAGLDACCLARQAAGEAVTCATLACVP